MEGFRDARRTYTFTMDDAVLDVFGPRIGAYGVAVYALLARHAKHQEAFPSYATLTKKLGMSRRGVINAIRTLVEVGLVQKATRTSAYGDPSSNLYTLVDLSTYHDHPTQDSGGSAQDAPPSAQDAPPSAQDAPPSAQDAPPSAQDAPGVVHMVHQGSAYGAPPLEGISLKGSRREEKKDPPISIVSSPTPAEHVRDHLCAVTGRRYRSLGEIPGCLKRGATIEQCTLVIDWWQAIKIRQNPEQEQYFDHTTPFRATNFDKYLAQAEVWQKDGARASPLARLTPGQRLTARASQRLIEEVLHARR
jgi:hypothetical protein